MSLDDLTPGVAVTPGPTAQPQVQVTPGPSGGPRPTSSGNLGRLTPKGRLPATQDAARQQEIEKTTADEDEMSPAAKEARLNRISISHPLLRRKLATDSNFANEVLKMEDPDELHGWSRVVQKWRMGREQVLMNLAAEELRRTGDPEDKAEYEYRRNRLARMGMRVDEPLKPGNKVEWMGPAAQVVHQMITGVSERPLEAAGAVAIGTGAGVATQGLLGLVTGPFIGLSAHFGASTFDQEAGSAYIDMKEAGATEENAQIGAIAVGLVAGSLESVGFGALTKPISKGMQKILKEELRRQLKGPKIQELLKGFGKDYIKSIATELGTEGAQELAQLTNREVQRRVGDLDIEALTTEEIGETLGAVLKETLMAMIVIGAPGAAFNTMVDAKTAKSAPELSDAIDELAGAMKESSLAQNNPEVAAQHFKDLINEIGGEYVYIDPEAARNTLTPEELAATGLDKQIADLPSTMYDIKVDAKEYFQRFILTDLHEKMSDHIRVREDGMSRARAQEFEESGIQDELAYMERGSQVAGETEYFEEELAPEEEKALQEEVDRSIKREVVVAEAVQEIDPETGEPLQVQQPSKEELQEEPRGKALMPEDIQQEAEFDLRRVDEELDIKVGNATAALRASAVAEQMNKMTPEEAKAARLAESKPVQEALEVADLRGEIQANRAEGGATTVAEVEAGLVGLFRSANEVGMTMKEYQAHLAKLKRGQDTSRRKREAGRLAAKAREKTDKWKTELANVREQVREALMRDAKWQAFFGLDGKIRLNRDQVAKLLWDIALDEQITFVRDDGLQVWPKPGVADAQANTRASDLMSALPTHGRGRAIWAEKSAKESLDVDQYAQQHGYSNGYELLVDLLTSPPFKVELDAASHDVMMQKHGDLLSEAEQLKAAREEIMNDDYSGFVEAELNAIRQARGQGRLKRSLLRDAARQLMRLEEVENVSAKKFFKSVGRAGRLAEKAIRKGDLELAGHYKFQQLLHIEMAIEAEKMNQKLEKGRKKLQDYRQRKYSLVKGDVYDTAMQELLDKGNFRVRPLSEKVAGGLEKVLNEKSNPSPVRTRAKKLLTENSRKHWRKMQVGEFLDMVEQAKEIHRAGAAVYKTLKADEQAQTEATISELGNQLDEVGSKTDQETRVKEKKNWKNTVKNKWNKYRVLGFHPETLVNSLDGGVSGGVWYRNTQGRIDQAYRRGYHKGQVGYIRRKASEMKTLTKIWEDNLTKDQRKTLGDDWNRLLGMQRAITGYEALMVVMNSGNEGNIEAMIRSGTITEQEHQQILSNAPKEFFKTAQAVWDNYERLRVEVAEREKLRWNDTPDWVESQPLVTPHGTFKGGYFPIVWDQEGSIAPTPAAFSTYEEGVRYGHFASSMTNRSHLEARKAVGDGRSLKLDPSVLAGHVDQIIYDLEVGDAINDIYKLIYSAEINAAFNQNNLKYKQEQLDLWLRDTITQEMLPTDVVNQGFRAVRRRATMAALGLSITTAIQQPLGLMQTAALVGKRNTLIATAQFMANPIGAWKQIVSENAYMYARGENFHKDISDSHTAMIESFGKDTKNYLAESAFFLIKMMQRPVDAITYMAALREANQMGLVDEEAQIHAENRVRTTQASSWFTERSAIERGTVSSRQQQSELVRLTTTMQGYFLAKYNTSLQAYGKVKKSSPLSWLNFMTNMVLLFTVDAILGSALYGLVPEDEEEIPTYVLGQTVGSILGSMPYGRPAEAIVTGREVGGTAQRAYEDVQKASKQIVEGDPDWAAAKAITRVAGFIFNKPAAQLARIMDALQAESEGKNVEWYHYITGYQED